MLQSGERQVATRREDVRRDHLARYEWAARELPKGSYVIDLGCGIGYGAQILAEAGHRVFAVDIDAETIAFAKEHFAHPAIEYVCAPAEAIYLPEADAAVCFEMIEHVSDPKPMLRRVCEAAPRLFASVPNEEVFPWRNYAFHFRHYTLDEFKDLLTATGFWVEWQGGQQGPESPVEPDTRGRTLVVAARRAEPNAMTEAGYNRLRAMSEAAARPAPPPERKAPERVAILGLGPSLEAYVDVVKRLGARDQLVDEVWGINAVGDVIQCDRVFHMDDVRVQEARAAARPDSNIAAMLRWLRTHPGPIYTSIPHPQYPGTVAFPLEEVINDLGGVAYFNSTAAYAVAYAVHIGVKSLYLFGCDFTYPNAHQAEKGRACVEYYLGIGKARGMTIGLPSGTSLMDGCATSDERVYGYDGVEIAFEDRPDGGRRVVMTPKPLPSAEEIEARYDHSKHPSPLMRA